jgi:hypothetical protein
MRVARWIRRYWRRVLIIVVAIYLIGPIVDVSRTRTVDCTGAVHASDCRAAGALERIGLFTTHPALRIVDWIPADAPGFHDPPGLRGFAVCQSATTGCK